MPDLSSRIFRFLDVCAKTAGDYDPAFDEPEERFNGPDSSMLYSAACFLRDGSTTDLRVFSSWESGCYREAEGIGKAEHDELVKLINSS